MQIVWSRSRRCLRAEAQMHSIAYLCLKFKELFGVTGIDTHTFAHYSKELVHRDIGYLRFIYKLWPQRYLEVDGSSLGEG